MAAKLWTLKVGSQKTSRLFGFEAIFFVILYSELLLFGRPGFDSRQLQTLKAQNFVALGPTGSKTSFLKDLIYLYKDKERKLALQHF